MESFRIENLTFAYPGKAVAALKDISLKIPQGSFVVIAGHSGCGKTTLLRHLKPCLSPHGKRAGNIFFENTHLSQLDKRAQSHRIGFVMQNPDNQIVTDKVWHELAFGLESLGFDTTSIRLRVAEMASFFGIQEWFYKDVCDLSGGQKQLLNLASIMVMQPKVLILDEPTSQLDPIAAAEFLTAVGKINRELGISVILTEHRLEEVFPLSNRVIIMDKGRIICDETPSQAGLRLKGQNHGMFLAMPAAMRIWSGVENNFPCPVTIKDGRDWVRHFTVKQPLPLEEEAVYTGTPSVELENVRFRYEKNLPNVVKGLSLKAYSGEIFAILGGNGTGKTTALSLISGLNRPYDGKVKINGESLGNIPHGKLFEGLLGVLPQNPLSLFVKKTVGEDLREILSDKGLTKEEINRRVSSVTALCRLEGLINCHPYDLSGGEQQRSALAKVLSLQPEILLLDEPTKGFDADFKQVFGRILNSLAKAGTTIIMVSHDIEFCAEYATRCALFFDGEIVSEGAPRKFFSENNFYTTAANRIMRNILPEAVTVKDAVFALGGIADSAEEDFPPYEFIKTENSASERNCETQYTPRHNRKLSKRTVSAALMILLAIPFTIYFGCYFLGDRKYYFISMLILLESMLPFALIFESCKPQAKELVTIAVLCGIAVAGRAAFFMVPQFKPVAAVVIIAGVAFGGESGFLVGVMTGFVSNMFFGQGPWTPWQMFAFGIIGFLAGVMFRKGLLSRHPASLAVFGGLAVFFIYGGVMNPAAVIMFQSKPTKEMFLTAYLSGIPFDLIHAVATVIFLLIISKPMLEKLDRIKIKYGMI